MTVLSVSYKSFWSRYLVFILIGVVLIAGTIIGIYNYQKNIVDKKEPKVEIYKPSDGQEYTDNQIVLEGKTEPKSTVKVNGKEATVDKKGNFAAEVILNEGTNVVTVEVTEKNGKNLIVERKVVRITPEPIATDATGASPTVSANGTLNNSGPENFWLPEASMLAAAGTAFIASKRRLSKIQKGQI